MIQHMRIQNFKSLREVSLELQRVNLLIGPNNCGKTNVLKALNFFSRALEGAYPSYERMTELTYRHVEEKNPSSAVLPIAIRIQDDTALFGALEVLPCKADRQLPPVYYRILAGKSKGGMFEGKLEDITVVDAWFQSFDSEFFMPGDWEIDVPDSYKSNTGFSSSYRGTSLVKNGETRSIARHVTGSTDLSFLPFEEIYSSFRVLTELSLYRIDPSMVLGPFPVIPEEHVADDASNLGTFLQNMRNRYHKVYKRIEQDMQRFIPEFTAISFDIVDVAQDDPKRMQYPDKSFVKMGLLDTHGQTFWADDLSEGILYFLALLAIVHQPHPPQLLLLEEPEKGIHPRRLREVLDLIVELAEEQNIQVILTTHSPLVVDYFSDMPESVFILEKPENETIVKNLQRDVIEPMNKTFREAGEEPIPYTEALGEHWAMGFLGGVPNAT